MQLLDHTANLKAFKKRMTPTILEHLYILLSEEKLIDSVYPDNIPFTHSGKIAFIDTEHWHCSGKVPYEKLLRYLSSDMQACWHALYAP